MGHMVCHIIIVSSESHDINRSHGISYWYSIKWVTWYQLVTWYIPPSSMIFKLCLIAINGVQEKALGELLWLYRAELDVTRYSKLYLPSDISFVFSFCSPSRWTRLPCDCMYCCTYGCMIRLDNYITCFCRV
jgi:hypothetical protein